MARHRSWILPVVGLTVSPMVGILLSVLLTNIEGTGLRFLVSAVGFLLLVVVPLVCLVLLIRALWALYQDTPRRRRARDMQNSRRMTSQGGPETHEAARMAALERGARMYSSLLRGESLPTVQNFRTPTAPDESVHLEFRGGYSRFYGMTVEHSTGSTFALGRPAFVAGALIAGTLINRHRRSAAEREAADQWRELQYCQMLVTSHRLIAEAGGQWLSFYYGAVTAVYISEPHMTMVLEFQDTEPLKVMSPDIAALSVHVVSALWGEEGLREHPEITEVRDRAHQLEG